jgi:hypothetical protein
VDPTSGADRDALELKRVEAENAELKIVSRVARQTSRTIASASNANGPRRTIAWLTDVAANAPAGRGQSEGALEG